MAAPAHIARENGKKGGRPKGRKNNKTIEKELKLEALRQRIFEATDSVLNSQLALAKGVSYLYRIDYETDDKGNRKQKRPVMVTADYEIEGYLRGDYDDESDMYYYITTEKPENSAIKDMFDRAYGRPVETVEATITNTLKIDV